MNVSEKIGPRPVITVDTPSLVIKPLVFCFFYFVQLFFCWYKNPHQCSLQSSLLLVIIYAFMPTLCKCQDALTTRSFCHAKLLPSHGRGQPCDLGHLASLTHQISRLSLCLKTAVWGSLSLFPSMFQRLMLSSYSTELVWVCFFHIGSWGTCFPSVVCLNLYEQPSSLEKDKNRCHRTASHFKNGKRFGGLCVWTWSRGVRKWWITTVENLITLFCLT